MLRRRIARQREETEVEPVLSETRLRELQQGVEQVVVDDDVLRYCVALAAATRAHPAVEVGASPRGAQALVLGAKVGARLDGRYNACIEDGTEVSTLALRHRVIGNYEGECEGVAPDQIVAQVTETLTSAAARI